MRFRARTWRSAGWPRKAVFALPFFRRDLPSLTGERVKLRLPVAGDFQEWAALRRESRAFLEPWEPSWAEDELEHAAWRQRLTRYRAEFAQGIAVPFFIFERSRSVLIGGITLGGIKRGVAQCGHLGYWIGERYSGQGYMLEAVRAVTIYAFEELKLHRVEAACIPGNSRSSRVLEKAGFRPEGTLRSYLKINGVWRDHRLYAKISNDPPGSV